MGWSAAYKWLVIDAVISLYQLFREGSEGDDDDDLQQLAGPLVDDGGSRSLEINSASYCKLLNSQVMCTLAATLLFSRTAR
jgi:hypothetical protein